MNHDVAYVFKDPFLRLGHLKSRKANAGSFGPVLATQKTELVLGNKNDWLACAINKPNFKPYCLILQVLMNETRARLLMRSTTIETNVVW